MGLLVNRDGSISIVRIGIGAALLGVLIFVGGFIWVRLEEGRFDSPLFIDVYPGAVEWYREERPGNSQRVFYLVEGATPEDVQAYYQNLLFEREGIDPEDFNPIDPQGVERCIRFPSSDPTEVFDEAVPGSGLYPYHFTCLFNDASQFGGSGSRETTVTIAPGIRNDVVEVPYDHTGKVMITYDQRWD
jgi:hypothetical protein